MHCRNRNSSDAIFRFCLAEASKNSEMGVMIKIQFTEILFLAASLVPLLHGSCKPQFQYRYPYDTVRRCATVYHRMAELD